MYSRLGLAGCVRGLVPLGEGGRGARHPPEPGPQPSAAPSSAAGLQVQHELTCRRCGQASRVLEEYMHLSLELPEPQVGSAMVRCSCAEVCRSQ